jgi:hypothetical protein
VCERRPATTGKVGQKNHLQNRQRPKICFKTGLIDVATGPKSKIQLQNTYWDLVIFHPGIYLLSGFFGPRELF